MRRFLFTTLSALSLLLCIAAAAEWVRSARSIDHPFVWHKSPLEGYAVVTGEGRLGVTHRLHVSPVVRAPAGATPAELAVWSQQFGPQSTRQFLGFAYWRIVHTSRAARHGTFYMGQERWVLVPYWAVVLATAAPPVVWFVRRRRARRARRAAAMNRCPTCGYDLRASGARCPECGTLRREEPKRAESEGGRDRTPQ